MEELTEVQFSGVKLVVDNRYGLQPQQNFSDLDLELRDESIQQTSVLCRDGWKLTVHIQGKQNAPVIITYHDIGTNFGSCFQSFFSCEEMAVVREKFTIYHITAPGQEDDAATLETPLESPTEYPNLDQLADQLLTVCEKFQIKKFIGFGAGAGANIFLRFALAHPEKVEALVLINATVRKAGWVEWGYLKFAIRSLHSGFISVYTEDYFVWYHLGYKTSYENEDLANIYRQWLSRINPENLAKFSQVYLDRNDVGVKRIEGPQGDLLGSTGDNLKSNVTCPVLNVVGAWSPHVDESVDLNTKLNPRDSTWFKVSDAGGLVQEENPCKLVESFILMLKGIGYAALERTDYKRK